MSRVAELQAWFGRQCDGSWEHRNGIRIETIDNPGWSVLIDLAGTNIDGREFHVIKLERSEHDWITCRIEAGQFQGFGGVENLDELLRTFLDWAERQAGLSVTNGL